MAVKVTVYGTADMSQINKAKADLKALEDQVGGSSGKIAANLKSAGDSMISTGKSLSLGVTAPLALLGASSVKTAADFQTTMASMQVNSGATGDQMKDLSKLAIKMGQDTVYSAGDAAQAMLELSKGGMSVAAIQGGALASAMNLAATEGIGLADASTIVIQAMNTFHLSAQDSAKAVDILAAGAVASTASVSDLAAGLKYVGSTAASLKVPMADTVTAMAAMNNAGIDATTAGTSLNRMLLGMAAPTSKAKDEMKALGLSFTDAHGTLLPMKDIVAELQDKMGGMGDSAKNAALKTIFGVEGMRAANVLLAGGTKSWDDLSAAVNKNGVAADMANARMSGTAGAIEAMKGSIETLQLAIGQALAPTVTSIAKDLAGVANVLSGLDPNVLKVAVSLGLFAAATGPVLIGVGAVSKGIGNTISGIQTMTSVTKSAIGITSDFVQGLRGFAWNADNVASKSLKFGNVLRDAGSAIADTTKATWEFIASSAASAAAWVKDTAVKVASTTATIAQNVASKAAAAGQWLLNAALSANPIGIVVVAIGALVAALIYLWNTNDGFRKALIGAWNAIRATAETVWNAVTSAVKVAFNLLVGWAENFTLPGIIASHWRQISAGASAMWNNVVDFFRDAPGRMLKALGDVSNLLYNIGKNIIDGLWNGLKATWTSVTNWLSTAVNSIGDTAKKILGIHSPSTVFHEIGTNITAGLTNGIEAGSTGVLSTVSSLGTKVATASTDALQGLVDGAQKKVTDAQNALKSFADNVSGMLAGSINFSQAFSDTEDAKKTAADEGKSFGGSFLGTLQAQAAKATDFSTKVKDLVKAGLSQDALQQVLSAGQAAGSSIAAELMKGGSAAIQKANDLVQATKDAAKSVSDLAAASYYDAGVANAKSQLAGYQAALAGQQAADTARQQTLAATGGTDDAFGRQAALSALATAQTTNNSKTVTIAPGAVQVHVGSGSDSGSVSQAVDMSFQNLLRQLRSA